MKAAWKTRNRKVCSTLQRPERRKRKSHVKNRLLLNIIVKVNLSSREISLDTEITSINIKLKSEYFIFFYIHYCSNTEKETGTRRVLHIFPTIETLLFSNDWKKGNAREIKVLLSFETNISLSDTWNSKSIDKLDIKDRSKTWFRVSSCRVS